jgi:hypothetical protein
MLRTGGSEPLHGADIAGPDHKLGTSVCKLVPKHGRVVEIIPRQTPQVGGILKELKSLINEQRALQGLDRVGHEAHG